MYTIFLATFISVGYYLSLFPNYIEILLIHLRLYTFTEYILFIIFYYFLINNIYAKRIILISIVPFSFLCIYNYITTNKLAYNNNIPLLEYSIFLTVILYYFFEKINYVSKIPLITKISFRISVALLINFSGNFFYYLMINTVNDQEYINQARLVSIIVTISKDLILALAWFAHEPLETEDSIIKIPDGLGLDDGIPLTRKINPNA